MVYDNILQAVGSTPLIRLQRMTGQDMAQIIVKYEGLNVGGSIKTRTALRMIDDAEAKGLIAPGKNVIVEPTSGNQGIGLALVGAVRGYEVVIIMPDSVSFERVKLIEHYGAKVVMIKDKGNIGECIDECIKTAYRMRDADTSVYIPQQFENPSNLLAHVEGTALEILDDIDFRIDGFCSGIGTGGTISGIGRVLKERFPGILIYAVEPENAAILAGGSIGSHYQMGIGDGIIPDNLDLSVFSKVEIISDTEALGVSRDLARKEGLMCGISSGTNVAAAIRMAKELGRGKTVLTVLPDTAERYFSTPLFDDRF